MKRWWCLIEPWRLLKEIWQLKISKELNCKYSFFINPVFFGILFFSLLCCFFGFLLINLNFLNIWGFLGVFCDVLKYLMKHSKKVMLNALVFGFLLKGHTYLNKLAAESFRFVQVYMMFSLTPATIELTRNLRKTPLIKLTKILFTLYKSMSVML